MGNVHPIFGGGRSKAGNEVGCPFTGRMMNSGDGWYKKTGDCGWCWWGCEPCREICQMPEGFFAWDLNAVSSGGLFETSASQTQPEVYEHCASFEKPGDFWGNSENCGPLCYWDANPDPRPNCWVPYDCRSGTCVELEREGCWRTSDAMFFDGIVDNSPIPTPECTTNSPLLENGKPAAGGGGLEVRGASIAAGGGVMVGASALGFALFKKIGAGKRKSNANKPERLELSGTAV